MDCPYRITPSKTPVTHHKSCEGQHARTSLRYHHEDQDRQSQSRSQSHYQRLCSSSHHNLHRGHSRSQCWIDAATTEVAHNNLAQPTEDTATDLAMTHHIGHIAALWVIDPKITVDHTHDHPTNLQGMNHADQIHTPAGQEEGHIPRRT